MHGLYPPKYRNEKIELTSGGGGSIEPLNPDPYSCSELINDYEKFKKSDKFKERRDRAQTIQKPLYDYLGLKWDGENWQWIGDWLYSFICSNQSIPKIVTDEMVEIAMSDTSFYSNTFFRTYKDESVGPIWRYLIGEIDKKLSMEKMTKLTLISGHDTTLGAILASLGYELNEIPPYRSHIVTELYIDQNNTPILRFIFNGNVINIRGKETISLNEFKIMTASSLSKCKY